MKVISSVLALVPVLAIALLPAPSSAQATKPAPAALATRRERLANIVFRAPAGWKIVPSDGDKRVFVAPDADATGKPARIQLIRGPEISGDFRAAFDRVVQAAMAGNKLVQEGDIEASKSSEGCDVLSKILIFDDGAGQRTFAHLVAAHVNNRFVLTVFEAYTPEMTQKRHPALVQFLKDMNFEGVVASRPADTRAAAPTPTQRDSSSPIGKNPEEIVRDENARRKPGIVSGRVYDAQGRPFHVPGAQVMIHVWGTTAAGERTFFDAQADENGHFALPVVHGLYVVDCYARMPLGDHVISVYMDALDQKATHVSEDSTPGIVKDFALKLTGPVLGGNPNSFAGYHGGGVYVTDGNNFKEAFFGALDRHYPKGTIVWVTLTPRGRAIDGSPAVVVTLDCDLERMKSGHTHPNIPLALYTATARIITPDGGSHALKVALLPSLNYADSVAVDFKPNPDDRRGGPETPNIFVLD